ncbi:MAG: hypothetical protein V3V41_06350, partial [Candidatus Heimdallarchaeota archaeon]
MVNIVSRIFGVDFIYLDILFCVIWMVILIRKKYILQWLFGVFGACVVFFTDYVIWFKLKGTRMIYELPFSEGPFLLYFSFTYGMIEFSYVAVMFSAKNWRKMLYWSLLLYGGWFAIGFLSQWIHWDDRVISIAREMTSARWRQVGMAIGGYLLLIVLKYTWKPFKQLTWPKIGFLLFVGFLVHFAMETTLLAAGIRPLDPGAFGVLAFNSLIEFNTGVP